MITLLFVAFFFTTAIGLVANSKEMGATSIVGQLEGIPALIISLGLTIGILILFVHSNQFYVLTINIIGYFLGRILALRENTRNPF